MDISKSDWKLFRERVPEWQERYMERLNGEYIELLKSSEPASKWFWELEDRIKRDKKHPGVMLALRKSDVVSDMVVMLRDNVITFDDLNGFSEELIEIIKRMLD